MADESTEWQFLDRMKRDDLPEMPRAVAQVIDEFNMRQHGLMSGSHGVGLFLDLLRDAGFTVEMDMHAHTVKPSRSSASVDIRDRRGIQIGDGNTQTNHF